MFIKVNQIWHNSKDSETLYFNTDTIVYFEATTVDGKRATNIYTEYDWYGNHCSKLDDNMRVYNPYLVLETPEEIYKMLSA